MGEREEISRCLCAGEYYRAIVGLLGRAVSTISREVSSNDGRDVQRAIAAQERALDRTRRPKQCLPCPQAHAEGDSERFPTSR
ncbi:helix-turn-helix domain-containing protein [Streptomyces sp. NPDC050535]|uniref:helix-turn-helix domain-containing protein n=1 Tax=Streptomyces sp. NPDC050535 TaxID=3365626 RepID=UPI00379EF757